MHGEQKVSLWWNCSMTDTGILSDVTRLQTQCCVEMILSLCVTSLVCASVFCAHRDVDVFQSYRSGCSSACCVCLVFVIVLCQEQDDRRRQMSSRFVWCCLDKGYQRWQDAPISPVHQKYILQAICAQENKYVVSWSREGFGRARHHAGASLQNCQNRINELLPMA